MSKNSGGSLGFMGLDNSDRFGGYSKKLQTNASGRTAQENYGRGPLKAGTTGDQAGPSTATGGKINGGATVRCPGMSINVGRGPTKGNQQ